MYDFYRQLNDWQDQYMIRGIKVFYDATVKQLHIDIATIDHLTIFHELNVENDLHVWRDATVRGDLFVGRTVHTKQLEYRTVVVRDSTILENLYVERDLFVDGDADFGNDVVIRDDCTVRGYLYAEHFYITEAQDFHVWKDLIVQDDATIKGDLLIEGGMLHETTNLFVSGDATIKGDLHVEGILSVRDLDVGVDDLFVIDDATVKDSLYVDNAIHTRNLFILDDLFCWDDATIKGDIHIDGWIYGDLHDIPAFDEVQDLHVWLDLVVQDDATIKDDLYIEGNLNWPGFTDLNLGSMQYAPEYPGAVLRADGGSNLGTMSTGFDSANYHNYYHWAGGSDVLQDYDIVLRAQLSDVGWGTDPVIKLWYQTLDGNAANARVDVYVWDTANVNWINGGHAWSNASWTQGTINSPGGGTWAPGSWFTIIIKVSSITGNWARIGELELTL